MHRSGQEQHQNNLIATVYRHLQRTIGIPQRARVIKANCCLKVHNAHLKYIISMSLQVISDECVHLSKHLNLSYSKFTADRFQSNSGMGDQCDRLYVN